MNTKSTTPSTIALAMTVVFSFGCRPESAAVEAPRPHMPAAALAFESTDPAVTAAQEAHDYLRLAELLMRKKRETSKPFYMFLAEDAVRAARTSQPHDPQAKLLEAMVRLDHHHFRAARDLALEVAPAVPDDPTPFLVAGDALLELGEYADAAAAYQHAVDVRPDLRSYNRGAHLRWLHGDVEGALELLEYALESGSQRDPASQAWCYVDLGNIFWHQGRTEAARKAANKALSIHPEYVPALSLKGRTLAQAGDTRGAQAAWRAAVAVLPTTRDLIDLGEIDRAIELAGDDPRPVAHYFARHNREPKRALEWAEAELKSRRNIAALDTYALALLRAGRVKQARKIIADAMRLGTPDAQLWLHFALIERAAGEEPAARKALSAALALNPKADPVLVRELRASQYDLLPQITAALRTDEPQAYDAVRREWIGKVTEWDVGIVPVLCQSAARCNVVPFERTSRGVVQGWLPTLEMSDGEHARLSTLCEPHAQCVATVRGTVRELILSAEEPTSVTFSNVAVLAARPGRAPERR